MKNFIFILFVLPISSFSKNLEVYITEGTLISGLSIENNSISSSNNQVNVINDTPFYINKKGDNNITVFYLNSSRESSTKKLARIYKSKIKPSIASKKSNNLVFKPLPFNTPFYYYGINNCLNAVTNNTFQYKKQAIKIVLFSKLSDIIFIDCNKSNHSTIQYSKLTKKYLLDYSYTSRPPPLHI